MTFARIENALTICRTHLDTLDRSDPNVIELENYLVAGLVVMIVSEYESLIESVFAERADMCGDTYVANYTKTTVSQKFRSPDLSKILETLGRFGSDYRGSFENNIVNTPEHAAWDNILKARHAVVHKKGNLNLTFSELETSYTKTKTVIAEICNVLGVASRTT